MPNIHVQWQKDQICNGTQCRTVKLARTILAWSRGLSAGFQVKCVDSMNRQNCIYLPLPHQSTDVSENNNMFNIIISMLYYARHANTAPHGPVLLLIDVDYILCKCSEPHALPKRGRPPTVCHSYNNDNVVC